MRDDAYPLTLKPTPGDNCAGLRLVDGPAELRVLSRPEPVAVAQSYLHTGGIDLKLCGIRREIRPIRKQSPLTSGGACDAAAVSAAAQPVPVTQEPRALGRWYELLGLEPFGVACVETPPGPMVIEVNDFPNYTGAPQADERLAAHIAARRFGRVSR